MRVPFMDLGRQHAPLRAALLAKMAEVLDSQGFILGPAVADFERSLAAYCGTAHAIGVSSGSDALLVALMALGVGPGDEVIVPSFTFFATAGAVARVGATPVFVDIDSRTFNLDAEAVRARFTERTKAIVPVHLYGRLADLDALRTDATARGIAILEDGAQSIGAEGPDGRRSGALGTLGCHSFFPAKNLGALGDGGAVTTDDAALAERVRVLRVHGSKPKYVHHLVGGNFRLDALQAALLAVKLPHLESWIAGRRANAERYRALFAEAGLVADGRIVPPDDGPGRHVYHQFVVRAAERDALKAFLEGRGVDTMVYYPLPLHLQACFRHLEVRAGELPATEQATAEVLALPIFPELTADEQAYVVESIAAFYCR